MKQVTRSFGVTHGIATCETCGWRTESYKNAQALAARHAKAHGHRVSGEVAYAYTYDGKSGR
ncbi:MAG: hypothetical protein ACRDZ4_13140 [Egibacteraceae bacterium]